MGVPYFIRELPDTEIQDDGHVSVVVAGIELAATVHLYRRFLERERLKLDAWDRQHRGAAIVSIRAEGAH